MERKIKTSLTYVLDSSSNIVKLKSIFNHFLHFSTIQISFVIENIAQSFEKINFQLSRTWAEPFRERQKVDKRLYRLDLCEMEKIISIVTTYTSHRVELFVNLTLYDKPNSTILNLTAFSTIAFINFLIASLSILNLYDISLLDIFEMRREWELN